MIAWLGDDRILLNNYHQLEKGKRKSFSTRIRKILNSQFEILELEYKGMLSQDSWCYLNYLETDNAIILPALSMNHDEENDKVALKMFKNIFDNKVIRQVYAQPLIKHGGALHCATWIHYI
jgi:agmatine/peptidylarginine deiminase